MYKNGSAHFGHVSHNVDETLGTVGDAVRDLLDQGARKVDAIKAKVIEVKDQTLLRGSDVLDHATELIKAHPIRSVGIAFGVGYIAMRLFRR